MKKTLIALAVAGVAAAPMTVMAAGHSVAVSGYAGVEYRTGDTGLGDDSESAGLIADDFTINVAASSEMNNGMTAYGNVRTDIGFTGTNAVGDNNHVGVKGGFGDLRLGEVPDPHHLAQLAGDAYFDSGFDPAGNASIGYNNTFGAVKLGVAYSPEGNGDDTAFGAQFDVAGLTIGVATYGGSAGSTNAVGNDGGNTTFGASYGLGDITLAAHSQDDDGDAGTAFKVAWADGGPLSADIAVHSHDAADDDGTRVNVNYALGGGAKVNLRINSGVEGSEFTRVLYLLSF